MTLQAIAYESGVANSSIASGTYDIQCAAPTFSPTAVTTMLRVGDYQHHDQRSDYPLHHGWHHTE